MAAPQKPDQVSLHSFADLQCKRIPTTLSATRTLHSQLVLYLFASASIPIKGGLAIPPLRF